MPICTNLRHQSYQAPKPRDTKTLRHRSQQSPKLPGTETPRHSITTWAYPSTAGDPHTLAVRFLVASSNSLGLMVVSAAAAAGAVVDEEEEEEEFASGTTLGASAGMMEARCTL